MGGWSVCRYNIRNKTPLDNDWETSYRVTNWPNDVDTAASLPSLVLATHTSGWKYFPMISSGCPPPSVSGQ